MISARRVARKPLDEPSQLGLQRSMPTAPTHQIILWSTDTSWRR